MPVWYIGTIEDQGLPVIVQRMNIGMGRAMGARVVHRELRSSHSPFLSQPKEVVAILLDAVSDFIGEPVVAEGLEDAESRENIIAPSLTWRPSSCLSYGLPLAFGHLLGRCVLLFYSARNLWRSAADTRPKGD